MRKAGILAFGILLLTAATTGVTLAQGTQPNVPTRPGTGTQYPDVSGVQAFSAASNYMSLAGYLRYLTYQQTDQWLTQAEATRIVAQQTGH